MARGNRRQLGRFIDEVRCIAAEDVADALRIRRLAPVVRRAALSAEWLQSPHCECDSAQGFGVHVLHEEPEHRLAVLVVSWLPGRGAPPHDHGTWAVVAGVRGAEINTHWRRLDGQSRAGYARLARSGAETLTAGRVLGFLPTAIHSVRNDSTQIAVSLHVYGKHPNYTDRSQYDPESGAVRAFNVALIEGEANA